MGEDEEKRRKGITQSRRVTRGSEYWALSRLEQYFLVSLSQVYIPLRLQYAVHRPAIPTAPKAPLMIGPQQLQEVEWQQALSEKLIAFVYSVECQ